MIRTDGIDGYRKVITVRCDKCELEVSNKDSRRGAQWLVDHLRMEGWSISTYAHCPKCNDPEPMKAKCENCPNVAYSAEYQTFNKPISNLRSFEAKLRADGWVVMRGKYACPKCAPEVPKRPRGSLYHYHVRFRIDGVLIGESTVKTDYPIDITVSEGCEDDAVVVSERQIQIGPRGAVLVDSKHYVR